MTLPLEVAKKAQYLIDPIDFCLKPNELSTLSCPAVDTDFAIKIDRSTYKCDKNLARTVFPKINQLLLENDKLNEIVLQSEDPDYNFRDVQSLLGGEIITINEKNAKLLYNIAIELGHSELEAVSEKFLTKNALEGKKWTKVMKSIYDVVFSVCVSVSWIGSIVLFICELIAFATVFGMAFIQLMIPITSGLASPTIPRAFDWLLMLPMLIYNINIVNIISLLAFYVYDSVTEQSFSPFPMIINLYTTFIHCWPFFRTLPEEKFEVLLIDSDSVTSKPKGHVSEQTQTTYKAVVGALSLIVVFFPYNQLILAFVDIVPVSLAAFLLLGYILHSLLCQFSSARDRFMKRANFSDPFLCAMYFSETKWHNLLTWTPGSQKTFRMSLLEAFFSKSTLGFFVSAAFVVLLIYDHEHFVWTQVAVGIPFFFLYTWPVLSTIDLGLIVSKKLVSRKKSEKQVESMKKWMHSDAQCRKWLESWLMWSKKATIIRYVRTLFMVFFLFTSLLAVFGALLSSVPVPADTNAIPKPLSESNSLLTNPVCKLNIYHHSITDYAALAMATLRGNETIQEFFGDNWSDKVEIVHPGKYPYNRYAGHISHYLLKGTPNVNVINVRSEINAYDYLAFTEMVSGSIVMDFLRSTIPYFSIYDETNRKFLGMIMNIPKLIFQRYSLTEIYTSYVHDYVKAIPENETSRTVILGHSLGGAIAKVVAKSSGRQTVTFCATGATSIWSTNETVGDQIQRSYVSVVPNLDLLSVSETKKGSQFMIPCEESFLRCHSLEHALCMLTALCGTYEQHYMYCLKLMGSRRSMKRILDIGHPYEVQNFTTL